MKYKIIEEITYGGQKHYYVKIRKYWLIWGYLNCGRIGYSSVIDAINTIDCDKTYKRRLEESKIRQKRVVDFY